MAQFLYAGEDVSLNALDVSKLTQEEAIAQLQNHNSALISRVRQLQGATAENERYRQQIADLRSHVKELEADRARKTDVYRQTQTRHKCELRLRATYHWQLVCDDPSRSSVLLTMQGEPGAIAAAV